MFFPENLNEEVAQYQQRDGDVNRAADTGSNLGEGHQAHTVACGQNRHVTGTAPPLWQQETMATSIGCMPIFFAHEETGRHQRGDGADNHQQVGQRECGDQFMPG